MYSDDACIRGNYLVPQERQIAGLEVLREASGTGGRADFCEKIARAVFYGMGVGCSEVDCAGKKIGSYMPLMV